ncbi:MAG: class I SAM-dependent methyltransferase [Gammaproteobacteria bacterium]|nr:class I SAM-dependent methyltransferase [Gammaproteobacteria bacterium]MDH5650453.1 class I SAM-dependent methyltransferase [Gammaproteobacteria bacterium]
MQRIPEPELMNEPAQVLAYAHADFAIPHQYFIDLFRDRFPDLSVKCEVLDLGCGPGDITRRFATAYPHAVLHGVDGAPNMLAEAERLNRQAQLANRIHLIEGRLPQLDLPPQHYQLVINNSLLHHLPDPFVLWDSLRRYAKPCADIFIMDLMRPASTVMAQQLVEKYAAGEPAILQQDFYHSLCAAFTPEELQVQLDEAALSGLQLEVVSDRHIIIYGSL